MKFVMMRIQNKDGFKRIVLWAGALVFLSLAGCEVIPGGEAVLGMAAYDRGVAYSRKGEYDQAISEYTKAIGLLPKATWVYASSYFGRGNTYFQKGDYDRAISDYDEAIENYPSRDDRADAYNNRGIVFCRKGDYGRAISDYDKAIEMNPKLAKAYTNRAIVYYLKRDYDRAWKDVQKGESLGSNPNPVFLKGLREDSGREK